MKPHKGIADTQLGFYEALGMMMALAMASNYKNWTIQEAETYLLPPLNMGQCKIYFTERDCLMGFVTWALVDEQSHAALLKKGQNPPPDRWGSGENLWLIDIVAPFGNTLHIVRDLQRNHFPHLHAHSIKRNLDGSVKRIKRWRNALVKKT